MCHDAENKERDNPADVSSVALEQPADFPFNETQCKHEAVQILKGKFKNDHLVYLSPYNLSCWVEH
jgi:hypothetical protein